MNNNKKRDDSDNNNVCYTGINSVKTGNYTKKEYLKTMDKYFKKECAVYIKSLKCKSCKKSKEMNTKEVMKQINAQKEIKPTKCQPV
jgi:hypothetical protein